VYPLSRRALVVALAGLALACSERASEPEPVIVKAGVHRVSLIVPDGWHHYDHGREHRFESSACDIVLEDAGPATPAAWRREIEAARDLFLQGRQPDAAELLDRLDLRRVFRDDRVRRSVAPDILTVRGGGTLDTVRAAYSRLLGTASEQPTPGLASLAHSELERLNHDGRREIEIDQHFWVDGKDAHLIVTWQRMTHDLRRRHVFVINIGHLFILWTEMGIESYLDPAFATMLDSLEFIDDDERESREPT
jgi:hypothetical protein